MSERRRQCPNCLYWMPIDYVTVDGCCSYTCAAEFQTATAPANAGPVIKKDAGKPRMDLLPPFALEEVGKVLGFGADKYSPDGWHTAATEWRRYLAAAGRHLNAFNKGEDIDPESGLPHLAHAVCSLLFVLEMSVRGDGVDDRYYGGKRG